MADSFSDQRIAEFSKRIGRDRKDDRLRITSNEINISKLNETVGIHSKRLDNLTAAAQGKNFNFIQDTDDAYIKKVPSGAMPYSGIKSFGGKTVVWNQLLNYKSEEVAGDAYAAVYSRNFSAVNNHKYLLISNIKSTIAYPKAYNMYINGYLFSNIGAKKITIGTNIFYDFINYTGSPKNTIFYFYPNSSGTGSGYADAEGTTLNITAQCFDLTLMFGAGNEPATVEEFETMFPADYYEYNAGELLSAGVSEVESMGKNLWKPIEVSTSKITYNVDGTYAVKGYASSTSKKLKDFLPDASVGMTGTLTILGDSAQNASGANITNQINLNIPGLGFSMQMFTGRTYTLTSEMLESRILMYASAVDTTAVHTVGPFQFELNDTRTEYTPYHESVSLHIPTAVQNLPGYGWSAGTAKNWVDWENKKYHQEVGRAIYNGSSNVRHLDTTTTHINYIIYISQLFSGGVLLRKSTWDCHFINNRFVHKKTDLITYGRLIGLMQTLKPSPFLCRPPMKHQNK